MKAAFNSTPVTEAEARRMAAQDGMPGCFAFPHSRPAPKTKIAANGFDLILDREAMGWPK